MKAKDLLLLGVFAFGVYQLVTLMRAKAAGAPASPALPGGQFIYPGPSPAPYVAGSTDAPP